MIYLNTGGTMVSLVRARQAHAAEVTPTVLLPRCTARRHQQGFTDLPAAAAAARVGSARARAPPMPRFFQDIVVEKAPARKGCQARARRYRRRSRRRRRARGGADEVLLHGPVVRAYAADVARLKEPAGRRSGTGGGASGGAARWPASLSTPPTVKGVRCHGTGVRGDCVATELEYIMPKYCDPTPRAGPFPSLERLASVDVHSAGLAQGGMARARAPHGQPLAAGATRALDAAPWTPHT